MVNVHDKIKEKGITLPAPPPEGGVYTPVREFGTSSLYCSDCGPNLGSSTVIGKLSGDLTVEEGRKTAYNYTLNLLANIEVKIGNLSKIKRFVRVLAFVNSVDGFAQQPQVVDGAPSLLVGLFGEEIGCPARSAIGTNALPSSVACEIEVLLEIET